MIAISAFHSNYEVNSLPLVREVKDFLKGAFRLNPPTKVVIPRWELGIVLQALGVGPFLNLQTRPRGKLGL